MDPELKLGELVQYTITLGPLSLAFPAILLTRVNLDNHNTGELPRAALPIELGSGHSIAISVVNLTMERLVLGVDSG